MKRREFITLLGGAAAAWPLAARAQQGERMRRIGVLGLDHGRSRNIRLASGRSCRVAQLGWTIGRNVRIDTRWAAGNADRNSQTRGGIGRARAGRHPGSWRAAVAPLLQATRTVPIVFASSADPVGAGFVEAWRGRAATPPDSCCSNIGLSANGWSCSRRSRRA